MNQKEKKINDAEFIGYHSMMALPRQPKYWVYFSPDNLFAILVDNMTGDVLFQMNRQTNEKIYENPKAKKAIMQKTIVIPKLFIKSMEKKFGTKLSPRNIT